MMLLGNPRRRRRGRKAKAGRRRGRRKMSALQMKYFGKRRGRRRSSATARRRVSRRRSGSRSVVIMNANPSRRRRARRSVRRSMRRYRRNPAYAPTIALSARSIINTAQNALIGGAGAVVTDLAYGQVLRFMPENVAVTIGSRYSESGGVNPAYYGAKLGMATVLGVLAANFAPGRFRRWVACGVEGAFTVSAYEIIRLMMPPTLALAAYTRRPGMGFNNAARVLPGANGVSRNGGTRLGAYTGRRLAGMGNVGTGGSTGGSIGTGVFTEGRVGESAIR